MQDIPVSDSSSPEFCKKKHIDISLPNKSIVRKNQKLMSSPATASSEGGTKLPALPSHLTSKEECKKVGPQNDFTFNTGWRKRKSGSKVRFADEHSSLIKENSKNQLNPSLDYASIEDKARASNTSLMINSNRSSQINSCLKKRNKSLSDHPYSFPDNCSEKI